MVVHANPAPHFESLEFNKKPNTPYLFSGIPVVDLSKPDSKFLLVKACEEFGFCKVINHGVPLDLINKLESEAVNFFSLSQSEKEKAGPASPFGYGDKKIGPNGDVGWVEYLLFKCNIDSDSRKFLNDSLKNPDKFCSVVNNYISSVKNLACEVLELLAEGLKSEEKDMFSKFLKDEKSDSVFRLNHYPPCPEISRNMIGFGEHTDPQIISVLRSNKTSGLQISIQDGSWIPVPPDENSLFVNVGDSLQVMTNGRFKSVRHRVIANSDNSRVSMIYFGGPPLEEKVVPIKSIMKDGEESLYKEFTWSEYKKSAYKSKLADNRLSLFEKFPPPLPYVDDLVKYPF